MSDMPGTEPVADRSAFERFARDLYSVLGWFASHPDVPVPTSIQLRTHLQADDPEATAERIAAASGSDVFGQATERDAAFVFTYLPDTRVNVEHYVRVQAQTTNPVQS